MAKRKLYIIGGHLSPAVAVIDEIKRRNLPWEVVFIGRRYAVEGSEAKAHEEAIMGEKHIRFISITTGRLQRAFSVYTIFSLLKIPVGFVQACMLYMREKPGITVSFGGYLALPIVVASWCFRVPVLTHEQTRVAGLANTIIAFFASKVCISFPDISHTFPKGKTIYTGLPIRKEILLKPRIIPFSLHLKKYPLMYITGGTTGAVSMNDILFPLIGELTKHYTIIHQTGDASLAKAAEIKKLLNEKLNARYIVRDYFSSENVGWIMQSADIVICRSGANTVSELALLGKKAICIPLPWSGGGEQMENARWLAVLGLAYVIPQKLANRERLLEGIRVLERSTSDKGVRAKQIRVNAAGSVVDEIAKLLL